VNRYEGLHLGECIAFENGANKLMIRSGVLEFVEMEKGFVVNVQDILLCRCDVDVRSFVPCHVRTPPSRLSFLQPLSFAIQSFDTVGR
jgi:hypothetical protein